MGRAHIFSGTVITCADCKTLMAIRGDGICSFGAWQPDWFMVKDRVWRDGQRAGKCRFLCVGCLENRIGRKLTADDFRRSAKVNFLGEKSVELRRRMRGLKPAKRLVNTKFKLPRAA